MQEDIEKFICKNKIKQHLDRLAEKHKGKRFLIYGTGKLFQKLKVLHYFDDFNIVGISDIKYYDFPEIENDFGFSVYKPSEVINAKPDVILCCLQNGYAIKKDLKNYVKYHKAKIKVESVAEYKTDSCLQKYFKSLRHVWGKFFADKNNNVYLIDDFGVKKKWTKKIKGLNIIFYGKNNKVVIHKNNLNKFKNSTVLLSGESTFLLKGQAIYISNMCFSTHTENCSIELGKNILMQGGTIILSQEPGQSVKIGNNSIFAPHLYIRSSDAHALYDKDSKKILNKFENIVIGDNVWCGYHTTILKGAEIADNTVVASNTLVNKKFKENYILLAGMPARILKRNICWDIKNPSCFGEFYTKKADT